MRHPRLLLLLLILLASPSQGRAAWLEARTNNFSVYSDGGEDKLRRSIDLLESYDALLRTLTGTTAPREARPLSVYLVRSTDALRQVNKLPSGALGFYAARVGGMAAFAVSTKLGGIGGEEVLLHEYTHHFASRHFPAAYPRWYSEGFAEYLMTARFTADHVEIGRFNPARAVALLRGTWLPIGRMLANGPGGIRSAELPQFYAQSWLMVHYILADPGRQQALARYFAARHRGVAEPEAFRDAFGVDHGGFDQALKRYMAGQIASRLIDRPPSSGQGATIRPMPRAADDLLLPHAALMLGIADPKREADTLARVRRVASNFANDAFALRVLARAEIAAGDRAAGLAIVDRLLDRSPDDAELLYLRGAADLFAGPADETVRQARYAAARPWFAKAVAADPGYYTARYRLAQTMPTDGGRRSDEALAHLIAANRLAPLVDDIAFDTASTLVARHRYAEASNVILPVAIDPHGRDAARLRALLALIREQAGNPAPPPSGPHPSAARR